MTAVAAILILALGVFLAAADWEVGDDGVPRIPGLFGGSQRVEYPGIEVEPAGGADDGVPDGRFHRSPPLPEHEDDPARGDSDRR